ncbi:MAG TPA: DNA mismatch repair protein MutS, partial [Thermoanaerobaculia bacterium]|nr:DNA mismatch repair protein MutS [Thermoanaerobaculia bacterium]
MYDDRLGRHRAEIARLTKRERAIGVARLVAFVLFVVAAIAKPVLAFVPLIAFVALIIASEPVKTSRRRAEAAAAFCERGMARMRGAWQGKGDAGNDFAEEHHPFAADLDLFGSGSLFELISIAATASGRATLASWLKHPERATAADVRARQATVASLRENVDLREDLFVVASEVSGEIEAAQIEEWAVEAPLLESRGELLTTIALGIFGAVALIWALLALFTLLPKVWALPLFVMLLLRALLRRRLRTSVQRVIGAVERREPALALLAGLLRRLEREDFWRAPAGAARIEKLRRLVALLDARRNQLFAPFAAVMLWSELVAFAIERWRRRSGRDIVAWMDAVGETEALLSLASFAYEHPSFATPEIVEGEVVFDAVAAAHPLIAEDRRVANDVRLGVLIVSGSNMSGKSTLLRTVGINAVLALAGAPVCA